MFWQICYNWLAAKIPRDSDKTQKTNNLKAVRLLGNVREFWGIDCQAFENAIWNAVSWCIFIHISSFAVVSLVHLELLSRFLLVLCLTIFEELLHLLLWRLRRRRRLLNPPLRRQLPPLRRQLNPPLRRLNPPLRKRTHDAKCNGTTTKEHSWPNGW